MLAIAGLSPEVAQGSVSVLDHLHDPSVATGGAVGRILAAIEREKSESRFRRLRAMITPRHSSRELDCLAQWRDFIQKPERG